MSGIFGLFDPAGPDVEALREAAARVTYRGRPVIHARPPVALGTFVRDGEEAGFIETEHGAFVADARVDATLSGTVAERLARRHSGAALLEAVLAARGPTALAELAADFALARFDAAAETLTLSRDAFGLRPIFWAERDSRVAFACDPAILVALGFATGELHRPTVASYLALRDFGGEQTAFVGIHRVLGGRWIRFGRREVGRWFRPEDVPEERATPDEFAESLRGAVVAAVSARARGRQVCVLQSGGRDSGAVAVALAKAGVRATCLTQVFAPEHACSEEEPALELAEALGHRWCKCSAPTDVTPDDIAALPLLAGTPAALWGTLQLRALRDAAEATGAAVVLDGQGGEPLFSAAPVAVLDLVRAGRPRMAAAAAKNFHSRWTYPYSVQAKAIFRALAPGPLLELRERFRPIPPWVRERVTTRVDPVTAPRSARHHLYVALASAGERPALEALERLFQTSNLEYACPLVDQRVVRLALALPVEFRVPLPGPKPILTRALLDGFDATRRKARFVSYFAHLADAVFKHFPSVLGAGSLSVAGKFVRPEGLTALREPRWRTGVLPLLSLEAWLSAGAA